MKLLDQELSELNFDDRTLSTKRCMEINNMKIRCPWKGYENNYYKIDISKKYLSDESGNIIYDKAFYEPPLYNDHNSYDVIIYKTEYHLFRTRCRSGNDKKIDNILYMDLVYEIIDAESIEESSKKDAVLYIISRIIIHRSPKIFRYKNHTEIFHVTVEYKGKVIE